MTFFFWGQDSGFVRNGIALLLVGRVGKLSERREYTAVSIAIYLWPSHTSRHAPSSDGYACTESSLFPTPRNTVECFSIAPPGPACSAPCNLSWPRNRFRFTNILWLQKLRISQVPSEVYGCINCSNSRIGPESSSIFALRMECLIRTECTSGFI